MTIGKVVTLVIALVIIAIMMYIGYKYILGSAKGVGGAGECVNQGGECAMERVDCERMDPSRDALFGLGCDPKKEGNMQGRYCCVPR